MKQLNFCHVTTFYPPYSAGGDGVAVQRLARELVKQGHRVTVVHDLDAFGTLKRSPMPPDGGAGDGVDVISLKSGWGMASPLVVQQTGRPVLQRRALAQILDGGFDVVNFHNASLIGGPGMFGMGGDALRVYTAHEHWLVCPTHILWRYKKEVCPSPDCIRCQLRYHRPPQLWRRTNLMDDSVRNIDEFIAMSEFSRTKHREFGFTRDMHVIPPCAGSATASGGITSPHPRPYFFFAGRLEESKGIQTILPLLREFPEADLLVAGDGSLKDLLKREGGRQVVLLNQVPSDALQTYYRHAIATLIPSLAYETFGLTVAESFRCGTPVIARNIGPFPDNVTRSGGGILFSNGEELVIAMRRLAADPGYRAQLGQRGRDAFLSLWEDSVSTGAYLQMIERSLNLRRQQTQPA
ncbi:MAG TPA: glycosyltransferase family 4 protein [Gemmatimonadaceae bacterium]|nr:glycosyltransferase family 4 protein [Gemmatimonadaceae bacterium]